MDDWVYIRLNSQAAGVGMVSRGIDMNYDLCP
jgi:hypothetical protein